MADAERFNMRLTLVLWCILLAGSMCLMLVAADHKTIVIADSGYEQGSIIEETVQATGRRGELSLLEKASEPAVFYLPFDREKKAENVVVENCYMERELRIFLKDADIETYEGQAVWGDIVPVVSASWEAQSEGLLIRLKMNGVYEYASSIEDDKIRVFACKPHDLYKLVVVIDPTGGGSETGVTKNGHAEKDIALSVSRQIQKKLENENIRLYFTRTEDREVTGEERCGLVYAANADLYLNIGVNSDENADKYGIAGRYNEAYFIPDFGNVQLADVLTRNVAVSGRNRAVGLFDADEESILKQFRLPAARVEVGYLSNAKETALLVQQEYQEKLAEGIANAIQEVYVNYYE